MSTEKLNINLSLSGKYWRRQPEFVVLIDNTVVHNSLVEVPSGEKFNVPFVVELEEDVEHTLEVRFINKMDSDCVQNEDKTEIIKDMLLNIEGLEIDDIDVGQLLWDNSIYTDLEGNVIEGCVNMGKNGSWTFKFSCPYYMWLLETM